MCGEKLNETKYGCYRRVQKEGMVQLASVLSTYTGTPLERGTWAPQFAISVISGHDRYYAVPHPPAHGTSMFSAMLKHFF